MTTRKTELERFRTFLRECVENEWMAKSGAEKIRFKNQKTAKDEERFGLDLEEYEQMMAAPDSADLTAQQNQETRVATELMRWTGMRISDAHKFCDSEIVRNGKGNGWNADFIQKKTKRRCVTPIPEHVVEMLQALPGHRKDGKKFYFTCTYTALRERVNTLAERAQKEIPFSHHFSPHCLRHTFAIQHIHAGTDIKWISKWLGHESVAVTLEHYGNWIGETKKLAEEVSEEANRRMMAKIAANPKSEEHRPHEFFCHAFRNEIAFPDPVQLMGAFTSRCRTHSCEKPISSASWANVLVSGIWARSTLNSCLWSMRA